MELLSRITNHVEQIASHRTNASKLTTKITNKKLPIFLNSHELSLVVFINNIAFCSNRAISMCHDAGLMQLVS